jgi:CheY-like chemotaxis protein
MRSNPTVLLVESDDEARDVMGTWLEAGGFDVLACPGPPGPGFVCIGERTGRCPLVDAVDVVVLNGRLDGCEVADGTSPYDLLLLYRTLGRPVVLVDGDETARRLLEEDDGMLFLDGGARSGHGLVDSVRGLMEHGGPGEGGP